jgi:hypothetical protein
MRYLTITILVASFVHAAQLDSAKVFALLKKGAELSAEKSEVLEKKLKAKPNDADSRIQLLSYYASPPQHLDLKTIKAARARLVAWVIENDPANGLGLFQIVTGVYRINCQGDDLSDPEGFQRIAQLWVEQVAANPADEKIRRKAVDAIQHCDPDKAESLLSAALDGAGLGRLYASAVLGVTGTAYHANEPNATDPAIREKPFAKKAMGANS